MKEPDLSFRHYFQGDPVILDRRLGMRGRSPEELAYDRAMRDWIEDLKHREKLEAERALQREKEELESIRFDRYLARRRERRL